MTDRTEITDTQIETLLTEASAAGDSEQVAICRRALDGDTEARAECARVIAAVNDDGDEIDSDGDCIRCGHPANSSSGHGTCDGPAHD